MNVAACVQTLALNREFVCNIVILTDLKMQHCNSDKGTGYSEKFGKVMKDL